MPNLGPQFMLDVKQILNEEHAYLVLDKEQPIPKPPIVTKDTLQFLQKEYARVTRPEKKQEVLDRIEKIRELFPAEFEQANR
jgi:hypothetical protein